MRRPTMLVVEDEGAIRRMIPRLATQWGWRTRDAASAEEALEELRSEPVDLLIADIALPKMNGCQLAREVVRRWPATRILLITGYVDMGLLGCVDGMPLLWKPFSFEALQAKVAAVMASPPWAPEGTP